MKILTGTPTIHRIGVSTDEVEKKLRSTFSVFYGEGEETPLELFLLGSEVTKFCLANPSVWGELHRRNSMELEYAQKFAAESAHRLYFRGAHRITTDVIRLIRQHADVAVHELTMKSMLAARPTRGSECHAWLPRLLWALHRSEAVITEQCTNAVTINWVDGKREFILNIVEGSKYVVVNNLYVLITDLTTELTALFEPVRYITTEDERKYANTWTSRKGEA